jgi:hypothetical protein
MFNDSRAYDPFYSDVVEYFSKRPDGRVLRASLKCCIDDGGLAEPFSDMSNSSSVRVFYVSLRLSAWPWHEVEPQIGDEIKAHSFLSGRVEAIAKGCDSSYLLTCKG